MTIDEAIAHAREVAKRRMAEYENHYDKDAHYYPIQCKKCAKEHDQLAEWLEELKQYRAIGTPEECLRNKDFLRFLANSMNQKKYETYLGIYNAVEKDGRDEE
jgi:hypothetical protein